MDLLVRFSHRVEVLSVLGLGSWVVGVRLLSWYQTVRGEGPLLDGRGHLLQSLAGSLLQRTVGVALARIKHDGLLVAVCLFVCLLDDVQRRQEVCL